MMTQVINRLRRFQEFVLEIGAAQAVLSLPAPRMLAVSDISSEGFAVVFAKFITEPEISSVSRDLFSSGHYSLAVQEAFKAVEKIVQQKAREFGLSGTQLMQNVFSEKQPKLYWTDRITISQQDEQKGYMLLYSGAMMGIRNPVTHEFGWIDHQEIALELITFAQHLLRKAKCARA